MKIVVVFWMVMFTISSQAQNNIRSRSISFDEDWSFSNESPESGPEKTDYDVSNWRKVDLPHDWSIEDLPNQINDSIVGPFKKGDFINHQVGYTVGGTGWYVKKFNSNRTYENKLVSIFFDGVYLVSDVWLNGHHLGTNPNGYSPFYYDLTAYLNPVGKENTIAVRVKNEGVNSRWYSGSGIYRHVKLTVTDRLHIAPWGVFVTTPKITPQSASVSVITSISNQFTSKDKISLVTTIIAPEGNELSNCRNEVAIDSKESKIVNQNISVSNPELWSIDTPKLYTAVTEIKKGRKVLDRVETKFGIRTLSFSSQDGLQLNGKEVLLKGGCLHHDNGPLGSKAIARAEVRKVELMKANGFNAIRTSHNPFSDVFMNACDSMGMLVIDEAFDMWNLGKSPDDYSNYFAERWNHDLTNLILRDRNHPSVIMWSIGNEIALPERFDSTGLATRSMLADRVHELDSTRPVTEAVARMGGWAKRSPDIFSLLDVGGYNYLYNKYESDHDSYPDRIMVGTESHANEALENFALAEKYPYVLGDFVWTAIDYIGEAGLGHNTLDTVKAYNHNMGWPWFNAYSGNIDLIGNKKTPSYYRDVVWRKTPIVLVVHSPVPEGMVENIPEFGWPDEIQSWTWPGAEGTPLQVRVFSRAPKVRLFLNGKVISETDIKEGEVIAEFMVPYQPGTLRAVNIVNGQETDATELKTVGKPYRIRLTADRSEIKTSRDDLSYVSVEVVDQNEQVVPYVSDVEVNFSVSGVGEIAGVGNGNPTDMSSFQQPRKKVFQGRGLVIVRPTGHSGKFKLSANAKGLTPGSLEIEVK